MHKGWNVNELRQTMKGIEFLTQTLSDFLIYIFANQCIISSFIFQTMNSVRSNNIRLKYHRFTPSGCKGLGIRKFEFVSKTQFL